MVRRCRGFELAEGLSLTGHLLLGWRINASGLVGGGARSWQHELYACGSTDCPDLVAAG